MDLIKFEKKIKFTNGIFELRYEGIPKDDNFDLNRIEILLEDFVNNHNQGDMIENVKIVRTMLRDCDEKLLVIFCENDKGSEFVKYFNSDLYLYEKIKKEENYKHDYRYKIKYESFSGIKLDYNNSVSNIASIDEKHFVTREVNQLLENIYSLKEVKAIKLNKDEKTLIEIYKLFYNENPDFTNKDINIKIQIMVFILSFFGISIHDDYTFSLYKDEKMPYSISLATLVNKLYPFGKIDSIKDNIKLNKETVKKIDIIGHCIRETISNEDKLCDILIIISKIIYVKMYRLSSNADAKRVCEFVEHPVGEVESSLKLVKKIKNKINNEIK